jgi:KaiC/GvpD/RAD55 family RecA-like ATPase
VDPSIVADPKHGPTRAAPAGPAVPEPTQAPGRPAGKGGRRAGAGPRPRATVTTQVAGGPAPAVLAVAQPAAATVAPPEPAQQASAVVEALATPEGHVVQPRTTPGYQFQPAQATRQPFDGKFSTGVDRLDQLLGGGYTSGCATLLFGPPFCGKQQLQQHAIVNAARQGVPVTVLLHTIGAEAMSNRLQAVDATFAAAEASGLVRYVDVHSKSLGEPTEYPHTTYIQNPHDLNEILQAVDDRSSRRARRAGLLAIESASTVLIDLGPAKAFTFLRTVLGRTLTVGGVGLVCLEGGMHPESEVQMAKHLCAGMIEMRKKGEAHCLHVEGLETAYARPGWIEYEFTSRQFRVTGSFASRTIR